MFTKKSIKDYIISERPIDEENDIIIRYSTKNLLSKHKLEEFPKKMRL